MTKVYSPPTELPWVAPNYSNYDYRAEQAREAKYAEDLKAWCRERSPGDYVGEIVRTPRADGYAQYMIASERPFILIHLPLGDAWRADGIWERGLRLKDAKELVDRDKGLRELFSGRAAQPEPEPEQPKKKVAKKKATKKSKPAKK